MKFDRTTMLVTDFEDIDKNQLMTDLVKWIFNCELTDFLRTVMEQFRIQCGLDPNQFCMLQSSTFPIRILHSLIISGYVGNEDLKPKFIYQSF